jgi:hypothetical protein
VFLSKKVANISDSEVCKTTTTKANLKLLPTTLRKRSSLVAKYVKFRAPINSGGVTPSQRFVEFQRFEIEGYRYKKEYIAKAGNAIKTKALESKNFCLFFFGRPEPAPPLGAVGLVWLSTSVLIKRPSLA